MSPSEFKDIIYSKDEETGIVLLTINTLASKNSIGGHTLYEFSRAIDLLEQDDSARVLIVTGARDPGCDDPKREYFSSGGYFHLNSSTAHHYEKTESGLYDVNQTRLILKMNRMKKPVITALNGCAIGGGVTLPLTTSDLIYASEHASLDFRFVKIGMMPELASTYILPRLVGLQKAKELVYFSQVISAGEAMELGIVNQVVPHEELLDFCWQRALELIPPKGVAHAIRLSKAAFNEPLLAQMEKTLDLENEGLHYCLSQPDFFEAVGARVERREPTYKGEVFDAPPFDLAAFIGDA